MIAFMVAGTASGVGKTTVALALMAAFKQQGCRVQPFKCGPDFLDTGHHTAICGRPSRNLDTWMLSKEANRTVFALGSRDADVAVVEGVMGLYDGATGASEEGSPAEIAKLLDLPVVLVLNAAKCARSIAAVVKGFESFDPALRFAGIVLNFVGSESHYRLLETAIRSVTTTPILGYLPKEASINIGERHLGLHTAEESAEVDRLDAYAQAARHLDLTPLLTLSHSVQSEAAPALAPRRVRLGVARDKAFSFYYEDNFDLLREAGAEIVPFSPLEDAALPPNLDGLYLGGGYPELYADALISNTSMIDGIRAFAKAGKPVYAECGGMIYLGQSLALLDGRVHAMAGVLPLAFEMTQRLVHFGYVEVTFVEDCVLGGKGTIVRGHSFHYSRAQATVETPAAYRLKYKLSGREEAEGFSRGNLLASYVHLHFRANPALAAAFVATAHRAQAMEVAQ